MTRLSKNVAKFTWAEVLEDRVFWNSWLKSRELVRLRLSSGKENVTDGVGASERQSTCTLADEREKSSVSRNDCGSAWRRQAAEEREEVGEEGEGGEEGGDERGEAREGKTEADEGTLSSNKSSQGRSTLES